MRTTIGRRWAPALALLAAAAAARPAATGQEPPTPPAPATDAQAQPPSFPAQVEQVIVDMVVTDKKGEPVKGIKKDDVTVLEDGNPQNLVSFEAVELPDKPLPVPPPPPRISVNSDTAEQRGRTFAIIFDDTHIKPWTANRAKGAVAAFLENGVREGDRVMLVTTSGGSWWTARMEAGRQKLLDMLKHFDGRYVPDHSPDRMSDYEAMRIHVYRDPLITQRVLRRFETYGVNTMGSNSSSDSNSLLAGTSDDPMVTSKAAEVYYQASTRLRITLDTVERVLNGLAGAKGRKSVILVSEGFIYDTNLDEFKRVNEASRRANAAVYFVNARGLEGIPDAMTAQFGPALPDQDVGFAFAETLDAVAGAEGVADDSGGFTVRNTNDLAGGIQRIARETQVYYLLGYIPTNTARDGKFRKIQVKLANGKGLQIRARKGYYAPSDTGKTAFEAKKGIDPVLQAALDSPWSVEGIPLRMTHYVGDEKSLGKASVLVVTDVDIKKLQFEEKDGRALDDLQFLLVVAQRQSGEFFRYDQTISMKLLPATRERLEHTWFSLSRDFELKSGDYQAKIVVRDKASGRVGTVIHEFEVPDLAGFRLSTPVLSDTRVPTAGEGIPGGGLAPVARREFASGSDLFCQIEVFGAKRDETTNMPRVSHGYVVRRADGSIFTSMAPSVITPTSLGKVSRLFGFRLRDAAPGDYDIVMSIRDDIGGQTIEEHEPFRVVAAPATAPAAPPGTP
jgi:VWFA-related protein